MLKAINIIKTAACVVILSGCFDMSLDMGITALCLLMVRGDWSALDCEFLPILRHNSRLTPDSLCVCVSVHTSCYSRP